MPPISASPIDMRLLLIAALIVLTGCNQESVPYRQVGGGAHGPALRHVDYLRDRAALDKSWVKTTLDTAQMQSLLSSIDFEHEVLLALAIGDVRGASGRVEIASAYIYTGVAQRPFNFTARFGVWGEGCLGRDVVAAPYALIVLPKAAVSSQAGGYDLMNFDDGCPPSGALR